MQSSAFEKWSHKHGGLGVDSAKSYVSYLTTVENDYGIDLDSDWSASKLLVARTHLSRDNSLNENTRRNRLSALNKYEDFCSRAGE